MLVAAAVVIRKCGDQFKSVVLPAMKTCDCTAPSQTVDCEYGVRGDNIQMQNPVEDFELCASRK